MLKQKILVVYHFKLKFMLILADSSVLANMNERMCSRMLRIHKV